jgi:hypothetical protein
MNAKKGPFGTISARFDLVTTSADKNKVALHDRTVLISRSNSAWLGIWKLGSCENC